MTGPKMASQTTRERLSGVRAAALVLAVAVVLLGLAADVAAQGSPCSAGTYSATGTNSPEPCQPCSLGTYASAPGATGCTPCPENRPSTLATESTSQADCQKCPLGHYCPIGQNPQKCPAGWYEPIGAQAKDRLESDCVSMPCKPGYWCGAGAAEGSTYVQNLVFDQTVSAAAVLGLDRATSLDISNVYVDGGDIIVNPVGTLADWLEFDTAPFTIAPLATGGNVTMTTEHFINENSPLYGLDNVNSSVTMEWYRASEPTEKFYFTVVMQFQMVTAIVTPQSFSYSTTQGTTDLTPPIETEIDVFNTMCSNAVLMTISNVSCDGTPFPVWFKLSNESDPFAQRRIEEQAGLPTVIKFELDPTLLPANLKASVDPNARYVPLEIPAADFETTCVQFDFIVNQVGVAIRRQVDIAYRLLKPCPPGTFSLSGDDADGCTPCSLDSYQNEEGRTFCNKCPESIPRTRRIGTISGDDCMVDRGRVRYGNGSLPCPRAAVCDTEVGLTIETLPIREGYWRVKPDSLSILECPRPKYCKGGRIIEPEENNVTATPAADLTARRRLDDDGNEVTWNRDNLCLSNHTGPFCYDCIPGSIKRTVEKICTQCTSVEYAQDRGRVAGLFFLFAFLGVSVVALVYYYARRYYLIGEGKAERTEMEIKLERLWKAVDITIPIRILVSFLQVVASMSQTFKDVLPPFYDQVRNIFALLALDLVNILDFGCALAAQNHFSSLLLSTLLPIACCFAVFAIGYILQWFTTTPALKEEYKNTTYTIFLIITFLVYPTCSTKVLATFVCLDLDEDVKVLATDPSISCTSERYQSYYSYAIFMSLVYPVGIPVLYAVLLWMERKKMYQYFSDNVKLAVAMRANNKDIRYLGFLWRPYKPRYFFFEVFELVRKLAQTSVVVFVAPGSSPQIVFQLLTTVFTIVVLNSFSPYLVWADALLALVAQWTIFGISLITLLIKFNQNAQITLKPEYNQDALDVLLTVIFFSVPVAAIIRASTQIMGEIFRIATWLPCARWYHSYLIWRDGVVLNSKPEKRRRKSLAQRPDRFMASHAPRRRLSIPKELQEDASSEDRAKAEEEEAKLMETLDGALQVLAKYRAQILAEEKALVEELETDRKENEELEKELHMIQNDIDRLEKMLQQHKIAEIESKEEKEEEQERARAIEEEQERMRPRRPTLMESIRRRGSSVQFGGVKRPSDLEAGKNSFSPSNKNEAASNNTSIFSFGRKSGETTRKKGTGSSQTGRAETAQKKDSSVKENTAQKKDSSVTESTSPKKQSSPEDSATSPSNAESSSTFASLFSFGRKSGDKDSAKKKASSTTAEETKDASKAEDPPTSPIHRTVSGAASLGRGGRKNVAGGEVSPSPTPRKEKESRSSVVETGTAGQSQLPADPFLKPREGSQASSTVTGDPTSKARESTIRLDSMSEML